MKKLKLYIKPFKKYFNVVKIDIEDKIIIFDSIQIEKVLVNKNKGDFWDSKQYDKFERMTKRYMTDLQSTAGIAFKKEFIRFPKELKYLRKFL